MKRKETSFDKMEMTDEIYIDSLHTIIDYLESRLANEQYDNRVMFQMLTEEQRKEYIEKVTKE